MWASALILKMKSDLLVPYMSTRAGKEFVIYVFHWHSRNGCWVDDLAIRTELLEFTNLHSTGYHISAQHQSPANYVLVTLSAKGNDLR